MTIKARTSKMIILVMQVISVSNVFHGFFVEPLQNVLISTIDNILLCKCLLIPQNIKILNMIKKYFLGQKSIQRSS